MNIKLFVVGTLITLPILGSAQESTDLVGKRNIEMRPSEKRFLTLKPSERNPYSKRAPEDGSTKNEAQNTEELAIRKKLSALDVSGSSRSFNGLRLLLGDILIERGMVLPQLIPNQTQQLKVVDVASEKIVLGWMDVESGELTGKTMQLQYNVDPVVRYVLQGQNTSNDGTATRLQMGVLRPKRTSSARNIIPE